jgi:hypothetical protein
MANVLKTEVSRLDRPEILAFLFHPRSEIHSPLSRATRGEDILIPVSKDAVIGARFHLTGKHSPNILFFHGNGEIVADYDDLADIYTRLGINFYPVDYRGYGRSTGRPTITAMLRDCREIFNYWTHWLAQKNYDGPRIVMGRSLGSSSALELVATHGDVIDGIIIESGFAYSDTLLGIMGFSLELFGLTEEDGFRNIDKIRAFEKPTLIIHAELDHILPFKEGLTLYEVSPSFDKMFLKIPGANHNDIFLKGIRDYMDAVRGLAEKAANA